MLKREDPQVFVMTVHILPCNVTGSRDVSEGVLRANGTPGSPGGPGEPLVDFVQKTFLKYLFVKLKVHMYISNNL